MNLRGIIWLELATTVSINLITLVKFLIQHSEIITIISTHWVQVGQWRQTNNKQQCRSVRWRTWQTHQPDITTVNLPET